jgi:hypothetical protein
MNEVPKFTPEDERRLDKMLHELEPESEPEDELTPIIKEALQQYQAPDSSDGAFHHCGGRMWVSVPVFTGAIADHERKRREIVASAERRMLDMRMRHDDMVDGLIRDKADSDHAWSLYATRKVEGAERRFFWAAMVAGILGAGNIPHVYQFACWMWGWV